MTELVAYQCENGIATLTLNNGKVNAFSPQLIDDFNADGYADVFVAGTGPDLRMRPTS